MSLLKWRMPVNLTILLASIVTMAMAGAGGAWAQGGWGQRCCTIMSNPGSPYSARVGETVSYDMELDYGKCAIGDVEWTWVPLTSGLQLAQVAGSEDDVAVTIGPDAPVDSLWRATARNYDPVTQATICQGQRVFNLDVADGQVLIADLETAQLDMPGANVFAGEPFEVTALVRNIGTLGTGIFANRIYVNDIPGETRVCGPLAPDEACVDQSWQLTLDAGLHHIKVCADDFLVITEEDEINNCRVSPVGVVEAERPDLVIDQMWVDPTELAEGGVGHVHVRVKNVGTEPSASFTLSVQAPGSLAPPSVRLAGLTPGESVLESFIWTAGTPGAWSIQAHADSDHEIRELRENNNTADVPVNILPAGPDLVFGVNDIYIDPSNPIANEGILYHVQLRNVGTIDVPADQLPVYFDVEVNGYSVRFSCHILPAGGTCPRAFTTVVRDPGTYQLTARADLDELVDELDENNNFRALTFNVSDGGPEITCQGNWVLTQTYPPIPAGEDPPVVVSTGSVKADANGDPCLVYFGQNVPTVCWRTEAVGGLRAVWEHDGFCPVSVAVEDTDAAPGDDDYWTYSVSIVP